MWLLRVHGEEELIAFLNSDKNADSSITATDGNTTLDLAAKERHDTLMFLQER